MSGVRPQVSFTVGLDDLAPAVRLREVALRLFAAHGPSATSIRMVAAAAGVSTGAVLHHYRSKAALQAAVFESVLGRLKGAISGVGLALPPMAAVRERRAVTDAFMRENPQIASYLARVYFEGGEPARRVFQAMGALQREQMEELVAAGIARPLPDPEIGLLLYHTITSATLLLRPLLRGMTGLDLDDPQTRRRFREAEIDLLSRALFQT